MTYCPKLVISGMYARQYTKRRFPKEFVISSRILSCTQSVKNPLFNIRLVRGPFARRSATVPQHLAGLTANGTETFDLNQGLVKLKLLSCR